MGFPESRMTAGFFSFSCKNGKHGMYTALPGHYVPSALLGNYASERHYQRFS